MAAVTAHQAFGADSGAHHEKAQGESGSLLRRAHLQRGAHAVVVPFGRVSLLIQTCQAKGDKQNALIADRSVCLAVSSLRASTDTTSIYQAALVPVGMAFAFALANLDPSIAGSRCVPQDSFPILARPLRSNANCWMPRSREHNAAHHSCKHIQSTAAGPRGSAGSVSRKSPSGAQRHTTMRCWKPSVPG
jgi:hypothetical protein